MYYYSTNESLDSIVKGLEPCHSDVIVAIGGSGDQAFALLESAGEVIVVDHDAQQIDYILKRRRLLEEGRVTDFLGSENDVQIAKYLQKRAEKIRHRLNRMVVYDPVDVFDFLEQENGFSKVYLSNVFGCRNAGRSRNYESLGMIASKLPPGGLVYVADHGRTMEISPEFYPKDFISYWLSYCMGRELSGKLPQGMIIDQRRTALARFHERNNWDTAVYRKAA